jgi:hypothetical protein
VRKSKGLLALEAVMKSGGPAVPAYKFEGAVPEFPRYVVKTLGGPGRPVHKRFATAALAVAEYERCRNAGRDGSLDYYYGVELVGVGSAGERLAVISKVTG